MGNAISQIQFFSVKIKCRHTLKKKFEIEEGEIVSDTEIPLRHVRMIMTKIREDEEGIDIAEFMGSLLATPEGDTVCTALVNIAFSYRPKIKY